MTCLSYSVIREVAVFLFQWFYFEFQQLYSQWQESKDSNIKPVTVKEM